MTTRWQQNLHFSIVDTQDFFFLLPKMKTNHCVNASQHEQRCNVFQTVLLYVVSYWLHTKESVQNNDNNSCNRAQQGDTWLGEVGIWSNHTFWISKRQTYWLRLFKKLSNSAHGKKTVSGKSILTTHRIQQHNLRAIRSNPIIAHRTKRVYVCFSCKLLPLGLFGFPHTSFRLPLTGCFFRRLRLVLYKHIGCC